MAPLIIDTGATVSISPYKTDFLSPILPVQPIQIKGIASGLLVKGIGDISFSLHNDQGEQHTMIQIFCFPLQTHNSNHQWETYNYYI
jgi:hypothetical protein